MIRTIGQTQIELVKEIHKATESFMRMPVFAIYEDETIHDIPQADTRVLQGYIAGLSWALYNTLEEVDR